MSKNRMQLIFGIDEDEQRRYVRGMQTEDRFFEAVRAINYRTTEIEVPDCLLRIDRTSTVDDMNGTDAIAYMNLEEFAEIDIQIKSSLYGLQVFKDAHPDFVGVMIVIPDDAAEGAIIEGILWGIQKFIEDSIE